MAEPFYADDLAAVEQDVAPLTLAVASAIKSHPYASGNPAITAMIACVVVIEAAASLLDLDATEAFEALLDAVRSDVLDVPMTDEVSGAFERLSSDAPLN